MHKGRQHPGLFSAPKWLLTTSLQPQGTQCLLLASTGTKDSNGTHTYMQAEHTNKKKKMTWP